MWPPCSGTGWTHARAGWVWGATSATELTKILSPLYIPLVTEGRPWEWGTPLLLIWPRFELLNDGEFMDFFTSSDNGLAVLFCFLICILRGSFSLIFLVPQCLTLLGRAEIFFYMAVKLWSRESSKRGAGTWG